MKLGIVNVVLFCSALGGLGTVGGLVMEDGQVTLGDLRYAPQALAAAKKFAGVDYAAAKGEALDIDDAERDELANVFAQTFVMPPGLSGVEAIVETGMGYVLLALEAIAPWVGDDTSPKPQALQLVTALQAKGVPLKAAA